MFIDVASNSYLEFQATINTGWLGGLIFDNYTTGEFKFAGVSADSGELVIGHHGRHGLVIDAAVDAGIIAGNDYDLSVALLAQLPHLGQERVNSGFF